MDLILCKFFIELQIYTIWFKSVKEGSLSNQSGSTFAR